MKVEVLQLEKTITHGSRDIQQFSHFGSWADPIQKYYTTFDIDIFNPYMDLIKENINTNTTEEFNQFCYKLNKILLLLKQYSDNGSWYNPMVAVPIKDYYMVHPGIDRLSILKGLGVKEHEFITLEREELNPTIIPSIQKYFTSTTKLDFKNNRLEIVSNQDIHDNKYMMIRRWIKNKGH